MLVMLLPKANKTETKTTTIMVIMVVVEEVDQIPMVVVAVAAEAATIKDTIPTTIQTVETLVHHPVGETMVVEVMATMEMAITCQTTRCHTTMLGEITTIEIISTCPICKHLA